VKEHLYEDEPHYEPERIYHQILCGIIIRFSIRMDFQSKSMHLLLKIVVQDYQCGGVHWVEEVLEVVEQEIQGESRMILLLLSW